MQKNNTKKIFLVLFNILKVKVSLTTLQEVLEKYHYLPSLPEISKFLKQWNIKNMIISDIPLDSLKQAPLPILSITNKDELFLIKGISDDNYLCLFQNTLAEKLVTATDLISSTKGVYLLMEVNKFSGEVNVDEKKKNIWAYKKSLLQIIFCVISIITIGFFKIDQSYLFFYILSVFGFFLSTYLLLKEYSFFETNSFDICKIGKLFDCHVVISSKGSKVLGGALTDISTSYFLFLILNCIYFGMNNINLSYLIPIVYCSSIGIFYSYFQQIKMKRYCLLCILISLILFFQIIGSYALYGFQISSSVTLTYFLLIFSLTFLILLIGKAFLQKNLAQKKADSRLQAIINSDLLVSHFKKNIFINRFFDNEISIGDMGAHFEIILFMNPLCHKCEEVLKGLPRLFLEFENLIYFRILYSGPPNDTHEAKKLFADLCFQINKLNDAKRIDFLASYSINKQSVNSNYELELLNEFTKQYEWSNDLGFEGTPALILNGIKIPSFFGIEELSIALRNIVVTE